MRPPLQPIAPRIEDPIELLLACHDKVRRFAGLALRLREHLGANGPDKSAQEAAQSILRYFNIAAPLHHDDEELDLFPALRQLAIDRLNQDLAQLEAEHAELAALWQSLQAWLQATVTGQPHTAPDTLAAFAQRYPAHAQREEELLYPYAKRLTPGQISQITSAMVARRTAP